MTTIDSNKKIQKLRTEEEMQNALANFCVQKHTLTVPPQIDDEDMVLSDVIEELLEARKKLAILEPLRDALISENAWEEAMRDPGGPGKVLEPVIHELVPVKTPIHDAIKASAIATREEAEKAANAEIARYSDRGWIADHIRIYHTPLSASTAKEVSEALKNNSDRLMFTGNPFTDNPSGTMQDIEKLRESVQAEESDEDAYFATGFTLSPEIMQDLESNKENAELAKEALYLIDLDDGYHGTENLEVLREEQEG